MWDQKQFHELNRVSTLLFLVPIWRLNSFSSMCQNIWLNGDYGGNNQKIYLHKVNNRNVCINMIFYCPVNLHDSSQTLYVHRNT